MTTRLCDSCGKPLLVVADPALSFQFCDRECRDRFLRSYVTRVRDDDRLRRRNGLA